ncbi:MAG: hypothetical protein JWO32_1754 [Bacteroidetes bacterium]|nr:hypothetical protein [Bacteroidota bacterium]
MMQRVIISLISILFFSSCQPDKLDIDISEINIPQLKCQRLEKDLFLINEVNFDAVNQSIKTRYGSFYEHYLSSFLVRGGTRDTLYKRTLLQFTHDEDVRACYNQVKKTYDETSVQQLLTNTNDCLKRFNYHFPKRKLPTRLVTCLTGWNYAAAYTDTALVVGLDMYLGDTSVFYQMLHLPQYRTHYMNSASILPDLVRGWLITEFDNSDPTTTLLNYTVFYGKIYYAAKALLPNTPDSLLLSYTSQQMNYCRENEKNLWGYFAEKNRLYDNNMKLVQELTTEGPFTSAISKECPPRIAMWVGLQIVKSYMKNNDVTLNDLMTEKNAAKILNKSKYRP